MYVRMCVRMYVHMYVCMYACLYVDHMRAVLMLLHTGWEAARGKHRVLYDDGITEYLNLTQEKWRMLAAAPASAASTGVVNRPKGSGTTKKRSLSATQPSSDRSAKKHQPGTAAQLCSQVLELKGGMFGCNLAAGHTGPHRLASRGASSTAPASAPPLAPLPADKAARGVKRRVVDGVTFQESTSPIRGDTSSAATSAATAEAVPGGLQARTSGNGTVATGRAPVAVAAAAAAPTPAATLPVCEALGNNRFRLARSQLAVGLAAGEKFGARLPGCGHTVRLKWPAQHAENFAFTLKSGCTRCAAAADS